MNRFMFPRRQVASLDLAEADRLLPAVDVSGLPEDRARRLEEFLMSEFEAAAAADARTVGSAHAEPTSVTDLGVLNAAPTPARGPRRRRTLTTIGAVAVGVAGACALVVVLPGGGDNRPPTPPAAGGHPAAHTTAAHPTSAASPSASATRGASPLTSAELLRAFHAVLPAGTSTKPDVNRVPLSAWLPTFLGIGWGAGAGSDVTTSHGASTLTINALWPREPAACPTKAEEPAGVCTRTPVKGGTVVVNKSRKNPVSGGGAQIWDVSWNLPNGQEVTADLVTDGANQAYTVPQLEAMVTDPAWRFVTEALPKPPKCSTWQQSIPENGTGSSGTCYSLPASH